MKKYLFSLSTLVLIISCKKDKIDLSSFWECNKAQHLDSAAVSGKILGSWIWSKQTCFDNGKTIPANKHIKAIFRNNNTFTVNEDLTTITQGTWKIVHLDGTSWRLELSSSSEYLYGRILFCENQVLFNDSYIDGCDNLFEKIN